MAQPSESGRFTRWHADALQRVGDYQVLEILGQFSHVATVRAAKPGESPVKLTIFDPQIARHQREEEQFLKMAGRAVGLRHPNIVEAREVARCEETGLVFVVSDDVSGQSLEELLSSGRLGDEAAIALLQPIIEGLAFASHKRLAHGSLHTGCIVLDAASTPRLEDLGIVKPAGGIMEIAHCMAPELAGTIGEPNIHVDLYAMGVIVYRCLTGAWPFAGDTFQAVVEARMDQEVPDPREREPGVSEGVANLVRWLAAREPRARYQAAHSASLDMLRVLAGRPPKGPKGSRLGGPHDLCDLLLAVAARGGDDHSPRGLWGKGPAYSFKAQLFSRGSFVSEKEFNTEVLTIGRSPDCDLHIDNPIVSRKHCRVRRIGAHFLLEPLSTTNTTSLGKTAVTSLTWFKPGVSLHLSDKFRVRLSWAPNLVVDPNLPPPPDLSQWTDPPTEKFNLSELRASMIDEVGQEPLAPDQVTTGSHEPASGGLMLVYERRGQEVQTPLKRPLQIGHATSCDLRLPRSAPYKAAILVPGPEEIRIYNLTSEASLVILNGEPVHDQAVLEPGDVTQVSGLEIRVIDT